MNNKLVSSALGFEIEVRGGTKVNFPDFSVLRGKRVKHVDVVNNSVGSVSLTLREQHTQQELIQNLPLDLLNPKSGSRIFINKIVDFSHSFIDGSSMSVSETKTFSFVVWYDDENFWNDIKVSRNRTEIHPLEIKLNSNTTFFSEHNTLKNRKYQNLLLTFPTVTPKGNEGILKANADSLLLTLSHAGKEFIKDVPISVFYQNETPYPLRLQNIQIDLTKSYIECKETSLIGKSVLFNCVIDDN